MKDLLRIAGGMGISVHGAYLADGVLGEWYELEREIYFDLRQAPSERRFSVAHELGHAHLGHRCEDDDEAERQADAYAAALLVDPKVYAAMERTGMCTHDIAEELGIPIDVLHAHVTRNYTRLRGVTYARSKMGTGQWAHRSATA